jgi:hypothetical protein
MSLVETDWWTMELPDEWEAEQEDDIVVIEDEDGVSCIEISCLVSGDAVVSEADLLEFSAELIDEGIPQQRVEIGDWQGRLFEHDDNEHHWREWFLRQGSHFVYVGYHCLLEHAGMDDAAVEEILSTLEPRVSTQ